MKSIIEIKKIEISAKTFFKKNNISKIKERLTKENIDKADNITDIATNVGIATLAITGTGIVAPALGLATGILAGASGVVVAGIYGVKAIKKTKDMMTKEDVVIEVQKQPSLAELGN